MRHGMCQVQKEGLRTVGSDILDGAPRVALRQLMQIGIGFDDVLPIHEGQRRNQSTG